MPKVVVVAGRGTCHVGPVYKVRDEGVTLAGDAHRVQCQCALVELDGLTAFYDVRDVGQSAPEDAANRTAAS